MIVDPDIWICMLEGYPLNESPFGLAEFTREGMYQSLKAHTKKDFGYDTVAWRKWFRDNEPNTIKWFTLTGDESYICIIQECPSMYISGWKTTKEEAREELQRLTGVDFGLDAVAWRQWYWENKPEIARRFVFE